MEVQLFIPCFVDQLYPSIGFNMVKVLQKVGCTVVYNPKQTCCGQPAFNAGFWEDAKDVCKKFMDDFKGESIIVAPSASCVGFVKNYYATLFKDTKDEQAVKALSSRIYEFSAFLVQVLGITDVGAHFDAKVTYHDSCAALRECKIKTEPRTLLQAVEGLQLVEMQDVETCCGFGGTFAIKFEAISSAMADQKVKNAITTSAEYIVSTDVSCLMHLEGYAQKNGLPIKCLHIADVLASGW